MDCKERPSLDAYLESGSDYQRIKSHLDLGCADCTHELRRRAETETSEDVRRVLIKLLTDFGILRAAGSARSDFADEVEIRDPLDGCFTDDILEAFLFRADHYDRVVGHVVDFGCPECRSVLVRLHDAAPADTRAILTKRLTALNVLGPASHRGFDGREWNLKTSELDAVPSEDLIR